MRQEVRQEAYLQLLEARIKTGGKTGSIPAAVGEIRNETGGEHRVAYLQLSGK